MKTFKLVAAVAAALVLAACTDKSPIGSFDSRSQNQLRYIEGCARLSITDTSTYNLAVANCLGRVRGFVDGHILTMEMLDNDLRPLWCVSPIISDGDVLESVLEVADEVAAATKQEISTTHSSIVGLTVFAVSSRYSCEEEK